MSSSVTYLELVDPSQNSHKFYEITVTEATLVVRYGRVQTAGTTQVKTFATPSEAAADATKKIKEKQRKGYQLIESPRQQGSEKPDIHQTGLKVSSPSPITATKDTKPALPTLQWRFNIGASAFGLAIDPHHCWCSNEKGQVFKLDHQGQVLQQIQLPNAVKCLVVDNIWLYAGCANGSVYDLTGKFPYLAYEVESGLDIFSLAIQDGTLGVSDANGSLTITDIEGDVLWTRLSSGKLGWMLCADSQGFYHGHAKGLTMYDLKSGRQEWHQPTQGKVLFGCQEGQTPDHRLYVATSGKQIQVFSKQGQLFSAYDCGASVYACTSDDTGDYLFAADSSAFIYSFDRQGNCLWKQATGCGSLQAMQYYENKLFGVTNQGVMVCFDLTDKKSTSTPEVINTSSILNTSTPLSVSINLEVVSQPKKGVILECFEEDSKLRVRPISPGYESTWHVQFPRNLRQLGSRYWVTELRESQQGGFYRVLGDIKQLQESQP